MLDMKKDASQWKEKILSTRAEATEIILQN